MFFFFFFFEKGEGKAARPRHCLTKMIILFYKGKYLHDAICIHVEGIIAIGCCFSMFHLAGSVNVSH